MKENLTFKKADLTVVFAVLLAAFAIMLAFSSGSTGTSAVIYQDGREVYSLSLATDKTVEILGEYHNKIAIQNGKIAVIDSDCPGKMCVHSGAIASSGQSIVCLPNRMEIRITGESDVDLVVG